MKQWAKDAVHVTCQMQQLRKTMSSFYITTPKILGEVTTNRQPILRSNDLCPEVLTVYFTEMRLFMSKGVTLTLNVTL